MLIKWNNRDLTPANLNSWLENFWGRDLFGDVAVASSTPAVNVKETETAYHLDVAAPGLDKSDFKIKVENKVLNISAEKKVENEEKKDNYTRREFSYQSFSRSFTLPDLVDTHQVKATYSNGILTVDIPKREEAKKTPQLIEVS